MWYGLRRGQASELQSPTICNEPTICNSGLQVDTILGGNWSVRPIREARPAITRPLRLPIPLPTLGINLPKRAGIPVLARADRRKNTEYTRQWSGHGIFLRGYRSKLSQLSFGSSSTKPVLLGPPMRRARRTWCICAPADEQKSMSACTRAIKPRTKQGIGS